jgi:hypothetical protein
LADYKAIGEYFSLFGPRAVLGGAGTENERQIRLFLGVIIGASSKAVYDAITNATSLEWKSFVIALIVSFVLFPQLYYSGGLNKKKISFAHWALAFQHGFFWSIALGKLSSSL